MNSTASARLLLAAAAMAFAPFARADEPEALPVCIYGGPYAAECTGASTSVPRADFNNCRRRDLVEISRR